MFRQLTPFAIAVAVGGLAHGARAAPTSTEPAAHSAPAAPSALSAAELGDISGGQKVNVQALTTQQLTATSTGNTVMAGTVNSGAVSFSPQALAGFNGVGNFVINTGANNALQGAVNISIVTVPNP